MVIVQSLGVAFYRGADACVLVYDVTDAKSFDNLVCHHTLLLRYHYHCHCHCRCYHDSLVKSPLVSLMIKWYGDMSLP
jgi:hypothetical protein